MQLLPGLSHTVNITKSQTRLWSAARFLLTLERKQRAKNHTVKLVANPSTARHETDGITI